MKQILPSIEYYFMHQEHLNYRKQTFESIKSSQIFSLVLFELIELHLFPYEIIFLVLQLIRSSLILVVLVVRDTFLILMR